KVFPALVYVKPIRETYEEGEKEREQIFGSGVIITPEGEVVTNHHVVDKAIEINCVLWNKEQLPATLVGDDKETDLALIQLEWDREAPLPFAEFADSDELTEGQFVMALGAPFGFTRSISLGILSNTLRYIGFRTIYKYNLWLQTDAAIGPGNSGGPLVNTDGQVVGINTLGVWVGTMGFSIPSNEVQRIVERLRSDGKVIRAWTGIELQALKDFDSDTFIDCEAGVLVKGVEDDSPADRAGMESGDILVAINGQKVDGTYVEQLPYIRWALGDLPIGEPAAVTVTRADVPVELSVTPVRKGRVEGEDFDCHRWNMTVKGISKHANPTLYFYCKKGVFVRAVRYPGNARDAGLQRHDILLKIGTEEVKTIEDVKRVYDALLADEEREKKVLLTVLRDGLERLLVLDYRKDYEKED
ncbi:MAG: trypsin-like peptidase domain-containing protein, partial [Planctomycetota bacterium]